MSRNRERTKRSYSREKTQKTQKKDWAKETSYIPVGRTSRAATPCRESGRSYFSQVQFLRFLRLFAATDIIDDDAMRTIIDLPEEQLQALDTYRRRLGISRAEAVRRAVAAFVPVKARPKVDFLSHPAFGSSKRFRQEDSVEFVRRLREEWE